MKLHTDSKSNRKHHLIPSVVMAGVYGALLSLSLTPAPAQAEISRGKAWVWADQPTTASYTPSTSYQYNSTGGTNKIARLGVGQYRVDLPRLGTASGTVHVSAYNGKHHCKVVYWTPSGTTEQVRVNCFNTSGQLVDGRFTTLFYKRSGTTSGTNGYLWYSGSSTPASYQWNSKGQSNTVTSLGTGRYQAKLPGLNVVGGTVLVTAYGSGSEKCKVVNWSNSGSNTLANVNCFRGNNPVNTAFTLSYLRSSDGVGLGYGHKGGYVWADNTTAASYTPSTTYQYNSTGAVNTITHSAVGSYRVRLPNLKPSNRTTTQVTAYGSNSEYCTVNGWGGDGSNGTYAYVDCYTYLGNPVNTRFTLTYLTNN